jgi:hypothetical protein
LEIPSNHKLSNKLVLGCHISGVFDVNRSQILTDDDYSIIEQWANSISKLNLQAIIFHNNFSEETILKFQSNHLIFIKIVHDVRFNPNVYRYYIYSKFLKKFSDKIESLFVTDVSDVLVLKNPFIQPLFVNNPDFVFCGDEQTIWDNEWMHQHGSHLRNQISDYFEIESKNKTQALLNCGIIGGTIQLIKSLIESIWQIHKFYNFNNTSSFTGDMGVFNYTLRKKYTNSIMHGAPVNTIFKAYVDDGVSWFQHK